jgi:hypothetical protein
VAELSHAELTWTTACPVKRTLYNDGNSCSFRVEGQWLGASYIGNPPFALERSGVTLADDAMERHFH